MLLILSGCTSMLFYPTQDYVLQPDALGIHYENLEVRSEDGTLLHGWWLHAQGQARATIVFFHGNAQNISNHIAHVYWLVDYGFDVVAVDYRGYGASGGTPDIAGSLEDIRASIAYVSGHPGMRHHPLVVLGQSLGGSLSVAALADDKARAAVDALVIIGTFSDYRREAQDVLAGYWLTWAFQWPLSFTVDNTYSPEKLISSLSPVPVLIMHGRDDGVVPVYHANRLYHAAREPKFLEILAGDHNHFLNHQGHRKVLLRYLEDFIK